MKSYATLLLICCLPATLTWGQTPSAPAPVVFEKQYPGILRNNIFSRYRKPYVAIEAQASHVKAPPPLAEETYYVLRGVGEDRGKLTAFVEYNHQGHADRYTIGSKVARGHVQALTIDGLDYVAPGSDPNQEVVTHVRVGQNLLGQAGSASGGMTPATRSPSASSGTAPASGDVNTSDIMKQLMEQRQRELGR